MRRSACVPQSCVVHGVGRLVLLGLWVGSLLGCSSSWWTDGGDASLDPDRAGAEFAWEQLQAAAPEIERYVFYPRLSTTYIDLMRRGSRGGPYEQGQLNERGLVTSMLRDTQLAVIATPFGSRFSGEEWARYRSLLARGEPCPCRGSKPTGSDPTSGPDDGTATRDASLPQPTRVIGTLLMFANAERAVAIRVVDDPWDPRRIWYFEVEGLRGDKAYYRMGDIARVYLDVATRRVPGIHGS